jgi:metal-dependent amidase/aminoacylase/carboxypeptidase family protein
VAYLSIWLAEVQFKKGSVVLLFQTAGETGKGAAKKISTNFKFP